MLDNSALVRIFIAGKIMERFTNLRVCSSPVAIEMHTVLSAVLA